MNDKQRKAMFAGKLNLWGTYNVTNPKFKAKKIYVHLASKNEKNSILVYRFKTDGSKQEHRMDARGMAETLKLAKAKRISS